jgi:hypothetical protein
MISPFSSLNFQGFCILITVVHVQSLWITSSHADGSAESGFRFVAHGADSLTVVQHKFLSVHGGSAISCSSIKNWHTSQLSKKTSWGNSVESWQWWDFPGLCISDGALGHLNGIMNRHNRRIWGSWPSLEIIEYWRDMPKVLWHADRLHHWAFFLSGINRDRRFISGHVRTLHSATVTLWHILAGQSAPTFWKHCQVLDECFLNDWIEMGSFLAWPKDHHT